jgi:hypothetical protein
MTTLNSAILNTPADAKNLFIVTRPRDGAVVSRVRSASFVHAPGASYDDVEAAPNAVRLVLEPLGSHGNQYWSRMDVDVPVGTEVALASDAQVDVWVEAAIAEERHLTRSVWRRADTYATMLMSAVFVGVIAFIITGGITQSLAVAFMPWAGVVALASLTGGFIFGYRVAVDDLKTAVADDETETIRGAAKAQRALNAAS